MTRDKILQTIREQHAQLEHWLAPLSEEVICQHPVVGWWTMKDVLGHIAMWEQVAIQFINDYKHTGVPQPLGIETDAQVDERNEREVAIRRDWSLARVRAEFDATYRDLLAAIESLSDADLSAPSPDPWDKETTLEKLIAINSYEHIPEHIAQIEQWRSGAVGQ